VQKIIVKSWNGSDWTGPASGTTAGDEVSAGGTAVNFNPVIATHRNTPYVIYQIENGSGVHLKYFNGVSWVALANSATGAGIAPIATGNERVIGSGLTLAPNGRPYVTIEFGDQGAGTVNSYATYYDGTSWQPFGNS